MVSPAGEMVSPAGEMVSPAGEMVSPAGEMVSPAGETRLLSAWTGFGSEALTASPRGMAGSG
jgi:hypothetical protein